MTAKSGARALFLDRDGVINVEKNYVHRIEDFEFVPGIFELCSRAAELGYLIVVVTNQAGIGRGYYTEADFLRLTDWMVAQFAARGIAIARVYHCPFHPTAGIGEYCRESFDRKPNPGMLLKARDELGLDLSRSAFVGDKESDMVAGRAAAVGSLIELVAREDEPPGDGADNGTEPLAGRDRAQPADDVKVVHDLFEATAWLPGAERGTAKWVHPA